MNRATIAKTMFKKKKKKEKKKVGGIVLPNIKSRI